MFLKSYHLDGTLKYSGISGFLPKEIKFKLRFNHFRLYDIEGITLHFFKEHSLVKEFNKKGNLSNIGYIKQGKIVKDSTKIIEDNITSTPETDIRSISSGNNFSEIDQIFYFSRTINFPETIFQRFLLK